MSYLTYLSEKPYDGKLRMDLKNGDLRRVQDGSN
jgi:hypothetical protein